MSATKPADISPIQVIVRLYAKQLRTPTLPDYKQAPMQLLPGGEHNKFLITDEGWGPAVPRCWSKEANQKTTLSLYEYFRRV